jgi:hypothetical protein
MRADSQTRANDLLAIWQQQRAAGIPPEQRWLPDDEFERDLEVIRQCLERKI